MPIRRLILNREVLTPLDSDELAAVWGGVSNKNPLCETRLCDVTSLNYSWCADTTCGIACTQNQNCPSINCS